jgi:branched-chain amino acid transport system substrate-binding protein
MKKTLALLFVLVLSFAAFGVATAQDENESADAEPIKVGALFDLSGATGDVGTPYADGVLAYVDWVNSQGGIEGRPIELLSQDYAYSVEIAENLYAQFVSEDVVVFHGWGTGDTLALRGRVADDEIPFISASYSDELNDQEEAPYNFLVATTYGDQMEIMMRYMVQEWEAAGESTADMRVVIFHNDSPFGTDPIPAAEAYAEGAGIGGVQGIPMPRGATDFTAELQQADDFGVTHIIVQNVSSPAALLLQNAEDFGLMDFIEFGCLNWCADELLVDLAGEATEGVLGAIPFTPTTVEVPGQEIPRAYLEERDRTLEEASLHFTQGWAAMEVLMEGVRIVLQDGDELTGPNIKAALETLEGFETGGLMAPVTFTPEDHRANRALQIYRVEDGVWLEASDLIDLRDFEGDDMAAASD